ncbi:MAG: PEGA domain-containing protein [Candidatus Wildermuthbacteria bacterium]|nr:PEGA domain-containing protein [Candidatus Wildermuthbacteria bacterium]
MNRMTKRTRTFLFFAAAILFLFTTPVVVLYSQGWRIDFDHKTVTHTGGLYVRVTPPRASIFLNDSFAKKTDFFFDSALITNLLPGEYSLRVEKEGYIPWKKTLSVQSSQVTEAKEVILFPENVEFQTLFSNVRKASLSPDSSLFAFQKKLDEKTWELTTFDISSNREIVLFEAPAGSQLKDIQWALNSNTLLLQFAQNGVEQKVRLDARENEQTETRPEPEQNTIETEPQANEANVLPSGVSSPDKKKLLLLSGNTIALYDKSSKEQIVLGTFRNEPKNLTWLNNDHIFFSVGDDIFVSELDVRGKEPNMVTLGAFKNPELFWSPGAKTLFVLSESKFLVSEKLLP